VTVTDATYSPDSTQILARASLEDSDIEPVADAVRSSSYTSHTSTNDGDSRSSKSSTAWGRHRSSNFGDNKLPDLQSPEDGKREDIC